MNKIKPKGGRRPAVESGINELYPEERLANAVILQAVEDYRAAIRRLKKYPKDEIAAGRKISIEEFFVSREFCIYSEADGKSLIGQIYAKELNRACDKANDVFRLKPQHSGFYASYDMWRRGKIAKRDAAAMCNMSCRSFYVKVKKFEEIKGISGGKEHE